MDLNNTEVKAERRLSGEFIRVFPGGKETQINCEGSHSSESAGMGLTLRIVWEVARRVAAESHRLLYLS